MIRFTCIAVRKKDYFTDDRVFVVTNETDQGGVLVALARAPIKGNLVLTIGGLFSLNPIACLAEPPSAILLVDASRRVKEFWSDVGGLICFYNNRFNFIDALKSVIQQKKRSILGVHLKVRQNNRGLRLGIRENIAEEAQ